MVSIVAVMGFDWRHVVKSILRIGFKKVTSIHLILPPWDDGRARDGINRIKEIATSAGLSEDKVIIHKHDPLKLGETVLGIAKLFVDLIPEGDVLLSLGGGMRALVVEALIAALSLDPAVRKRIKVVIDLEGHEESVEFGADEVALYSLRLPGGQGENAVLDLAVKKGFVTPKLVADKLGKPKSTSHALIKALERKGLLRRVRWGVYEPTELGRMIRKIQQVRSI